MALDLFSCIKSFVAVIHYNGFASAARHSHISTPVLTKQIKWLEEYLDIPAELLREKEEQVSPLMKKTKK